MTEAGNTARNQSRKQARVAEDTRELTPSRRLKVAGIVLALCLLFDQLTKSIAQGELRGHPGRSYLGDVFRLEYSENPGAFLSLGAKLPDSMRFLILTVFVAISLGAAAWYLLTLPRLTRLNLVALSLVIGGGVSNLLDRMFRPGGAVVDFMNMGIGSLRTGIFNVADMVIMLGVGIIFVTMFRQQSQSQG